MENKKKVLIINESPLIRTYLEEKLKDFALEVLTAMNGLDGIVKIRGEDPDLIIMDQNLSRMSSRELLKEKNDDPNAKSIPVIMLTGKLSKEDVLEIARLKVQKFFTKPVKMDSLFESIAKYLGISIELDSTPCLIDAHFNDEILFVEVATGLNSEKIDLLGYKIPAILALYGVTMPKVLIILTDMKLTDTDYGKLSLLFKTVRDVTHTPAGGIKVLTPSQEVRSFLSRSKEHGTIEVVDNINSAMDKLLGMKVSDFLEEGYEVVKGDFFLSKKAGKDESDAIGLDFAGDKPDQSEGDSTSVPSRDNASPNSGLTVAVADDDPIIRELIKTVFRKTGGNVLAFENGRQFVQGIEKEPPDLLFLDLLMPEMDGFAVLDELKRRKTEFPVIVLSALSKKETVIKALRYGVKSYLTKPLKPADILQKTEEVMRISV